MNEPAILNSCGIDLEQPSDSDFPLALSPGNVGLGGFVWNSPDSLSFCEERSLFLEQRPKNRSFIGEDEPIIARRGVTADESTR